MIRRQLLCTRPPLLASRRADPLSLPGRELVRICARIDQQAPSDGAFEVRECIDDPTRGPIYTIAGFPYPVPEDQPTEEEYDLEFGAEEEEE